MNTHSNTSSALARSCLSFEERPPTPPEIAKYRRSKTLEPGRRFIHPGIAEDIEKLDLDAKIFGRKNDPLNISAAALINSPPLSIVERLNQAKAEKNYFTLKREPLGATYSRNHIIPDRFTEGKLAYGKSTQSCDPAKDIIFPEMSESAFAGDDLYKRSHGVYGVGEQKRRGYDWHVNPDDFRFGIKGDTIAYNGVSKNIAQALMGSDALDSRISNKKVEDQRNMGDLLGKTRDLGQGSKERTEQFVYGMPSAYTKRSKAQWGALETIRGRYSEDSLLPDDDLGKSITPGFRNISTDDRVYGCPTVRHDIPVPRRRSVADPQNYGDEVPGKDLIHPRTLAGSVTVEEGELEVIRPKNKIRSIFKSIGYDLDDDSFEMLFERSSCESGYATISAFRDVLNNHLESR